MVYASGEKMTDRISVNSVSASGIVLLEVAIESVGWR